MKRSPVFVLALLLGSSIYSFGSISCDTLYQKIRNINAWRYPSKIRSFSSQKAQTNLESYRFLLNQTEVLEKLPETLEEKAAFLQAVMERVPLAEEKLPSFISLLDEGMNPYKKRKTVQKLNFNEGLTEGQIEKILGTLLIKNRVNADTFRSLIRNGWAKNLGLYQRQLFNDQVLKNGVIAAIKDLGIAGKPGFWERVRKHSKKVSVLAEVSFTLLGVKPVLSGKLPYYISSLSPFTHLQWDKVHSDIAEKGIDTAFEKFKQRYGRWTGFEQAWGRFRGAYLTGMFAYTIGAMLEEEKKKQKEHQEMEAEIARQSTQLEEKTTQYETATINTVLESQLKNWTTDFTRDHGRAPTDPEIKFIKSILESTLK